jgi:hypothetical protein
MKTKSACNFAFFTRRVLIVLFVLAGVFMLPLLFLLANPAVGGGDSAAQSREKSPQGHSGTLEKMMVASGSVATVVDLSRVNDSGSATQRLNAFCFVVKPNSFFTILVFNNVYVALS